MSKVIVYGGQDSNESLLEIVSKEGITVVDFFANWCGPCRALLPVLDELSEEVDYRIAKVNVDEYKDVPAFYGVRTIPTLVIFKDGKPIETLIGARSKEQLKKEIEDLM